VSTKDHESSEARLARTVSWYDSEAADYVERFETLQLREDMLRFVASLPSNVLPILDAGCAGGRDVEMFERMGESAIGTDLSTGLLKEATARTAVPLVQSDARRLPFAPASFSGVWSVAVLLHLSRDGARRACHEFARVLVPGGALFLALRHGVGEYNGQGPDDARWFNLFLESEVVALTEGAGFNVRSARTSNGVGTPGRWVNVHATKADGPDELTAATCKALG
jgi:SAM-dependent methyltransferase